MPDKLRICVLILRAIIQYRVSIWNITTDKTIQLIDKKLQNDLNSLFDYFKCSLQTLEQKYLMVHKD